MILFQTRPNTHKTFAEILLYSKEQLRIKNLVQFDINDANDCHNYLVCFDVGCMRYIIDLDEKRVIDKKRFILNK